MDLSRRDFFLSGIGQALRAAARAGERLAGPTGIERGGPTLLRPPGALDEADFLAACTRCDACLIACPKGAIRRSGPELGRDASGTPVIAPGEAPCWMCPDLPCIRACEPGALLPLDDPGQARMGRARVRGEGCFSAGGSPCDVCAERCPIRPAAITVGRGEEPGIDPGRCTGCGVCAWLCPAGALEIVAHNGKYISHSGSNGES